MEILELVQNLMVLMARIHPEFLRAAAQEVFENQEEL